MSVLVHASGLGIDAGLAASLVNRAAVQLRPEIEPEPTARSAFDETTARLGPPSASGVQGAESMLEWLLVHDAADQELAAAVASVVDHRQSESRRSGDFAELDRRTELRAVFIVGNGVAWEIHDRLQGSGLYVGRLPAMSIGDAEGWARRLIDRENEHRALPRRALIVAPRDDPFTRALAAAVLEPIRARLMRHGFAVHVVDRLAGSEGAWGLVILLTHGREPPDTGMPKLADANLLAGLCQGGCVVFHLGCHGAGIAAKPRYGGLPQLFGGTQRSPRDVFSAFGRDCLIAGASAVIAHLDGTWSTTFEASAPICDSLEWLVSGQGSVGKCVENLTADANRLGREAYAHAQANEENGQHWLRHLDLAGFVCLGDPSHVVAFES